MASKWSGSFSLVPVSSTSAKEKTMWVHRKGSMSSGWSACSPSRAIAKPLYTQNLWKCCPAISQRSERHWYGYWTRGSILQKMQWGDISFFMSLWIRLFNLIAIFLFCFCFKGENSNMNKNCAFLMLLLSNYKLMEMKYWTPVKKIYYNGFENLNT